MTIVRTRKRENPFVQLDREFIEYDERLSWKAKGILAYCLSKPDDWTLRFNDLVKRAKDSKDALSSGFGELEKFGYVNRYREREDDGTFGQFVYEVFERPEFNETFLQKLREPQPADEKTKKAKKKTAGTRASKGTAPQPDFPVTEKPDTEKPVTENPPLSNIDLSDIDFRDIKGRTDGREIYDFIVSNGYPHRGAKDFAMNLVANQSIKPGTYTNQDVLNCIAESLHEQQNPLPGKERIKHPYKWAVIKMQYLIEDRQEAAAHPVAPNQRGKKAAGGKKVRVEKLPEWFGEEYVPPNRTPEEEAKLEADRLALQERILGRKERRQEPQE